MSNVKFTVYNSIGQQVAELINKPLAAGNHEVNFNASSVSRRILSGVYFYRLSAGAYVSTKKMILLQ